MNVSIYIWWIFKSVGIIFANSCILLLRSDDWFDVILTYICVFVLVLWQSWVGFEFLSLLIDDSSGDIHCSRTIDIGFGVWCLLGREETLFHHQHLLRCRLCKLLINASSCFLFAFTYFPSLSPSLFSFSQTSNVSVPQLFFYYFFSFFYRHSIHGVGTTVEERDRERERVKYNTFLGLQIDIKYN